MGLVSAIRRRVAQFVAASRKIAAQDLFFFSGLALMSYGAWRVYEPAGFILAGFALWIVSVIGARRA